MQSYKLVNNQWQEQPLDSNRPYLQQALGKFAPNQFQAHLEKVDPIKYANSRNHLSGAVTGLSVYVEHGLISSRQLMDYAEQVLQQHQQSRQQAASFFQQLVWREFFQRKLAENPEHLWQDVQPLKTGFDASDYQTEMPKDIVDGQTNSALINALVQELLTTGYLHNHGRLYLAAYVIHWRHVKWQVGAKWMLNLLLDGNLSSNNYSWQWVASTGSNKPYFFNLENAQKFCKGYFSEDALSRDNNPMFAQSYDDLKQQLFPNAGAF
jgi:deoxyribodipyrimidine photo-lyase